MPQYRCLKDIFTYCNNEEHWNEVHAKLKKEDPTIKIISAANVKCELNKETCGFNYRDPGTIDPRLGGGIKESIIPVGDGSKKETKKETKKVEKKTIEQGSFFE